MPGSISRLIPLLRDEADEAAAAELWQHFAPRLIGLARRRLKHIEFLPPDASAQDVAASAFWQLFSNIRGGCYPEADDRESLWRLLAVMTRHKINDRIKYHRAQKHAHTRADVGDVATLKSEVAGPDEIAELEDEFVHLLELLDNATLQKVAVLKLEGHSSADIADQIDSSTRTVQRMLRLVREVWSKHLLAPANQ